MACSVAGWRTIAAAGLFACGPFSGMVASTHSIVTIDKQRTATAPGRMVSVPSAQSSRPVWKAGFRCSDESAITRKPPCFWRTRSVRGMLFDRACVGPAYSMLRALICPTGKSVRPAPDRVRPVPSFCKNNSLRQLVETLFRICAIPCRKRGASRSSRGRWCGMRWTRQCQARESARTSDAVADVGEVVWS